MIILTPDDAKRGPSRAMEEQSARVRALGDEETRLTISINDLHETERTEKARIDGEIQKMRNVHSAERLLLELEIKQLEDDRAPLLVPIEEVRKEANDRNEKSKEREHSVFAREEAVAQREDAMIAAEEAHTERMEQEADRVQLLNEREQNLDTREARIKSAEDGTRDSARMLNEKWADYHQAVQKKEKELTEREAIVAAGEAANKTRAEEVEKQAQRNLDDRHGIEDTYRAIEEARKHLGIK